MRGLSMKDLALKVGIPKWRLPLIYFQGKASLTKHMHHMPVFNGMETVISDLHGENYQLYIMSSNSRRNIGRFLAQHGLSSYFKRVYGNAGWFNKAVKLKKAMQQNGLEPHKTVYVGDEVRDLVAAHAAGMPVIAVSWGFGNEKQLLAHNPTILVRTPAELAKALVDWGRSI